MSMVRRRHRFGPERGRRVFVRAAPDRRRSVVSRGPIGRLVQPGGQRALCPERSGLASQGQERRLKCVFGRVPVAQDGATNAQDERPVALDQRGKGQLSRLTAAGGELLEQLAVGERTDRARVEERAELHERVAAVLDRHGSSLPVGLLQISRVNAASGLARSRFVAHQAIFHRFGPGPEAGWSGFGGLGLEIAPELDVVEEAGVIERAHADLTAFERLVLRGHGRLLHVVEVDFDQAALDPTDEPDVVPAVGPGRAHGPGPGDRDPRRPFTRKMLLACSSAALARWV